MTASSTGLLTPPDCGSQRERRDSGSHDLHPFTARLDPPPILALTGLAAGRNTVLDGLRSVIDRKLSASSHEGSDVARGRSTLVVILSRLSCSVACHHCFRAPANGSKA